MDAGGFWTWEMGAKKMANQAVFGYEKFHPRKTEFTEAARQWNNVFAGGSKPPGVGARRRTEIEGGKRSGY